MNVKLGNYQNQAIINYKCSSTAVSFLYWEFDGQREYQIESYGKIQVNIKYREKTQEMEWIQHALRREEGKTTRIAFEETPRIY